MAEAMTSGKVVGMRNGSSETDTSLQCGARFASAVHAERMVGSGRVALDPVSSTRERSITMRNPCLIPAPIGSGVSRRLAMTVVAVTACASVWATGAVALSPVKTTVTAKAEASMTRVTGQVSSRQPACKARRRVRVIRIGGTYSPPAVRANSRGRFVITAATSPYQQFYVRAPATRVRVNGRTVLCGYGRSPNFSPPL